MGFSEVNAKSFDTEKKVEQEELNLKLRLIINVGKIQSQQAAKRKCIRENSDIEIESDDIFQELYSAQFTIEENDNSNNNVKLETNYYTVEETSPKALRRFTEKINDVIKNRCRDRLYKKVIVNIYSPSFIDKPTFLYLFWASMPPSCLYSLSKESQDKAMRKLDKQKSFILFFSFDEIKLKNECSKLELSKITGDAHPMDLNADIVKLSALISHYTYFYLDFLELKEWPFIRSQKLKAWAENLFTNKKKNHSEDDLLWDEDVWNDFIDDILAEKFNSSESEKESVSTQQNTPSFFKKFFSYRAEVAVTKRIISRIIEVLNYTTKEKDKAKRIIFNIVTTCQKLQHPIDFYDFYNVCEYWKYLGDSGFEKYAKQWHVVHGKDIYNKCYSHLEKFRSPTDIGWYLTIPSDNQHENYENRIHFVDCIDTGMGFISGFGGLLFTKVVESEPLLDYIFCCKGTDFDSIIRDWIGTNILQGLTGFSFQHIHSIYLARKLDQVIAYHGNLWFTGHSLGGGLASAAAIATRNRHAITFNAAGLNFLGVKVNQLINNLESVLHPSQAWNRVHPFRYEDEVLDFAQRTLGRYLTIGILERGFGQNAVEVSTGDGKSEDNIKKPSSWCQESNNIETHILDSIVQFFKDIGAKVLDGPHFLKVSASKHGIGNFLNKEFLGSLRPYSLDSTKDPKTETIKINVNGANLNLMAESAKKQK